MSLDLSKLENLHTETDKTVGRCPACAEKGRDKNGDHLVIYPDGKYTCVAENTPKHRKDIFRLAGKMDASSVSGPVPVVIRRPVGGPGNLRRYGRFDPTSTV